MGLDVAIYELIDPKGALFRTAHCRKRFEKGHHCQFHIVEPSDLICFQGGFEHFMIEVHERVFDEETMFKKRGLDHHDYELTGYDGGYVYTRKDKLKELEEKLKSTGDENDIIFQTCHADDVIFKANEQVNWKWGRNKYVILGKEINCQRRGENQKFHDDKKWDKGIFVLSRAQLLKDWDEYFSDVDFYGHTKEQSRQRFKENIIDKFIEGKTIVIYQ